MGVFSAIQLIAETRIVEASERGELKNLPGEGKPLELEDESHIAPELRMAYKILKNSNCLPPELADRKEAANLANLLDNCQDEQQKLAAMRKLRVLLNRMAGGQKRHMRLEENDVYYQKILARLEVHEATEAVARRK